VKWIVLLLPLLLAPAVASINLTATTGETFIKFSWDSGYEVQVWHNGVYDLNTSLNYLYLSDLNPTERHRLTLYNQSNLSELLDDMTVETAMPGALFYVLTGIGLVFFLLSLWRTPSYFSILGGIFSAVVLGVTSITMVQQGPLFLYLLGSMAFMPFLLMVWNAYKIRGQSFV
jgi:hypothetical protein